MSERHGTPAPGWAHLRQARPDLDGLACADLLAQTAGLRGNLRLGRSLKEVWLIGELPEGADLLTQRVPEGAQEGGTDGEVEERIEAALDATGLPWRKREGGWVVPADASRPCEVLVSATPEGGHVEGLLLSWDALAPEEHSALAHFLCRAQLGLRFARAELRDREAVLTSTVGLRDIESGLAHAVGGVTAGARLLARESAALLLPGTASAYLAFTGAGCHAPAAAP